MSEDMLSEIKSELSENKKKHVIVLHKRFIHDLLTEKEKVIFTPLRSIQISGKRGLKNMRLILWKTQSMKTTGKD